MQIWITAAQSACGNHHLVKGCVNPSCKRIYKGREDIDVRTFQFCERSVFEYFFGQRVFNGEDLEDFGVS